MRHLFSYLIILISVLPVSCKKATAKPRVIPETIENVTLKVNESFSRDFCCGGVKIVVQATHFQTSVINLTIGGTDYYYTPSLNFTGTDEVVLEFSSINLASSSPPSVDSRLRLKFNITN